MMKDVNIGAWGHVSVAQPYNEALGVCVECKNTGPSIT